MNPTESLKDYKRVRTLAIRSLFEIIEQSKCPPDEWERAAAALTEKAPLD